MRWRDVRLEALREAPYAFGATLANWRDAQESRWRNRLREVPCNILAELDGATVGMVSGAAPLNGEVMLISMWVAPSARGKGGGDALVGAILAWALQQGADRVSLHVRDDNEPAIALYRRNGFVDVGAKERESENEPPERRMMRRLAS
jgi:ribosomal protein S18 acetylase RimI-like enzyme